jgi:DNA-cytosine methyltransferase
MGMKVLSLFDGMSCGKVALDRAGINIDTYSRAGQQNLEYYAFEVDKYAIQISEKNHPNIVHLGDVRDWKKFGFGEGYFDLIIAGSPCQGFSMAGQQLAFDDERSKLYFVFEEILKYFKPKYWMLENVKMSGKNRDIITERLGVQPVMINSSLVSAQHRTRYYWANFPITQPEDNGIMLNDVLEHGVADRDKSFCLDANYWKGGNLKSYFQKHRRQLVFSKDMLCHVGDADIKGHDSVKRVYHPAGKCPTLTTMGGGHREPKILVLPCALTERRTEEARKIRREHRKLTGKDWSPRRGKELVPRTDGKMNCLTASFSNKEHTVVEEDYTWRKLTPLECERLQTLPDLYTEGVSNTQRYKMLGNGWTVDVITHIFKCMLGVE